MEKFRKKIDLLDEKIVKLLDERMSLAYEIAKVKKEKGRGVFDAGREEEVFAKLHDLPKECIRDEEVKELYEHIIAISREHGKRGLK